MPTQSESQYYATNQGTIQPTNQSWLKHGICDVYKKRLAAKRITNDQVQSFCDWANLIDTYKIAKNLVIQDCVFASTAKFAVFCVADWILC